MLILIIKRKSVAIQADDRNGSHHKKKLPGTQCLLLSFGACCYSVVDWNVLWKQGVLFRHVSHENKNTQVSPLPWGPPNKPSCKGSTKHDKWFKIYLPPRILNKSILLMFKYAIPALTINKKHQNICFGFRYRRTRAHTRVF